MTRSTPTLPAYESVADLLEHLGNIPAERIRLCPMPGQATERDVIRVEAREGRLCELVDGVLVEKAMGYYESCLAVVLGRYLEEFAAKHELGIVAGADGTVRLMRGLVRIPDVSFVSWDQLPGRELPADPTPDLAPDLAVEVLSEGNTPEEMKRKLKDYFLASVRLVWLVDPVKRIVTVYTAPDRFVRLKEGQALDGGDVLPGFRLPLAELFSRVGKPGGARRQGRKGKRNGKR